MQRLNYIKAHKQSDIRLRRTVDFNPNCATVRKRCKRKASERVRSVRAMQNGSGFGSGPGAGNACAAYWEYRVDYVQMRHVHWLLCSVSVLFMVTAIVANQLVIWAVITARHLHTSTNLYILNLSVADFFVGVLVIPYRTLEMLADCETTTSFLTPSNCPVLRTITNVCINAGIISVVFVTVERYVAVVHPHSFRPQMKNTSHVTVKIAAIWILSLLLIVPEILSEYLVAEVTMASHLGSVSIAYCKPLSAVVLSLEYAIVHLVAIYLAPLAVIVFTSISIARAFRRLANEQSRRSSLSKSVGSTQRSKGKLTRTIIVIAVLYTISWTPYNILKMLVLFGDLERNSHELFLTILADLCSFSSAALSPIVLFTMSSSFRSGLTATPNAAAVLLRKRSTMAIEETTVDARSRLATLTDGKTVNSASVCEALTLLNVSSHPS